VIARTLRILLGGEAGEFDPEDGVFESGSNQILLVLKLLVLDLIKRDDHVQSGHPPVEGVGDQEGGVEVVEGRVEDDLLESATAEQREADLL
jgi:hypothetical protein